MAMAMQKAKMFQSFDHLRAAGITDKQARALVELVDDCVQTHTATLASKSDLLVTKAELRQEMAEMKTELKSDISALQVSMHLMQRLFFGGTLLILLSIAALFLHQ